MRSLIVLVAGTPAPTDGLCPTCFNPALINVPVLTLSLSGVTPAGAQTYCADCRQRVHP